MYNNFNKNIKICRYNIRMHKFILRQVDSTFDCYQQFVQFYWQAKDISFDCISLNLEKWFSANMCAVLGGLLDELSFTNAIEIHSETPKLFDTLRKNGFLDSYNVPSISDSYHTTIPYLKLNVSENRYFYEYINKDLVNSYAFPNVGETLKRKISESIYEIFINAKIHSNSEYVYTCGQFFPKKDIIEFTIVDMGQGFKNNINGRFNKDMSAVQAIKWAAASGNTTKRNTPGGIGLAILKEFIHFNDGTFQIVSDDGFYEYSKQKEIYNTLSDPFPGTIVNMKFRTNDSCSYYLTKEIDINGIF